MTLTIAPATLTNHSRAFETGQAYESAPTPKRHDHALVEHPVAPGLNGGYVGYCATCGLAAWEPTTIESDPTQGA